MLHKWSTLGQRWRLRNTPKARPAPKRVRASVRAARPAPARRSANRRRARPADSAHREAPIIAGSAIGGPGARAPPPARGPAPSDRSGSRSAQDPNRFYLSAAVDRRGRAAVGRGGAGRGPLSDRGGSASLFLARGDPPVGHAAAAFRAPRLTNRRS